MSEILQARVEQKVDTEANWLANPLILLSGECAFVEQVGGVPINFKIGDGTKTFADLPYWINYAANVVITPTSPGGTLPNPGSAGKVMFVSTGSYTNIGGGTSPLVAPANNLTLLFWNGTTWSILVSIPVVASDGPRIDRIETNNVFRGSDIQTNLQYFLKNITLTGLIVNKTDNVHIYQIARGWTDPADSVVKWIISFAINGTVVTNRFAGFLANAYTEPVADAKGSRIDYITLGALNGSGVTGTIIVDWSEYPTATQQLFNTSGTWKNSLLSPNYYRPNKPVTVLASAVQRGSSNVDAELLRLDNNRVFKGSEIVVSLLNFLLDIQISGLTVNNTDVVHLYFVYRNFPNPTTPQWTLALGINGQRVSQFSATGYVEPTADGSGRKIASLSLTPIGSVPNNTAVSAIAIVDWAAITDGSGIAYFSSTDRLKTQISPNQYNQKVPVSAPPGIARIDKNDLFSGDFIVAPLPDFLLDLKFNGIVAPATSSAVHVYYTYRNYTQSVGVQRWVLAIAIDETRICQFLADNYTEPAAQPNGDIIDVIQLAGISGAASATAIVNWAKLTSGVNTAYAGGANYPKSLLSPKTYNKRLGGSSIGNKTNLPSTTLPNNIYTVLNDIDPNNILPYTGPNVFPRPDLVRQYSQRLFVDRLLLAFPLNTDVRWDLTLTDKLTIASPRTGDDDVTYTHPTPSTIIAKSVIINGGTNYNNRTIGFNQVSTRETTGASTLVGAMFIGDSTIQGQGTEIGVPDGYAHRGWAVVHEQFMKSKIDFLIAQGYATSDIQTYFTTGTSGVITSPDMAKYSYFNLGQIAPEPYNLIYRGITKAYTVAAEGRGGWGFYMYINKPVLMPRAQGGWDFLGCGDGSGTDYTGSAAQMLKYDRTAWIPANIIDTPAMRAYTTSVMFFTGTDLASYVTWATGVANNPTFNYFFDGAKTDTITDSAGNVWAIRFSIKKYLERMRTMTDAGVRLTTGYGTKVTDPTLWDVFKPTHIVLQSCQNDGNVAHFGLMAKSLSDSIKAEYVANSYGLVNIGFSIIDGAGTYFPKLYPEIDQYSAMNEFQRGVHNDNLARLLTEITSETTNKVFVVCNTHISPTAKSIIYRLSNSPEYELSGLNQDSYRVASRQTPGISAHQNAFGHRCWGIQNYAWIKYTLGLITT